VVAIGWNKSSRGEQCSEYKMRLICCLAENPSAETPSPAWALSRRRPLPLPLPLSQFPTRAAMDPLACEGDYLEWSSDEDASGASPELPGLLELQSAVDAAIEALGGAVVPKLTWSCPKVGAAGGF